MPFFSVDIGLSLFLSYSFIAVLSSCSGILCHWDKIWHLSPNNCSNRMPF